MTSLLQTPIHSLKRDFFNARCIMNFLAMSLLLAIAGPENTILVPFDVRISFWTAWVAMLWAVGILMFNLVGKASAIVTFSNWQQSCAAFALSVPVAAAAGCALAASFFPMYYYEFSWLNVQTEAVWLTPFLGVILLELHFTQVPKSLRHTRRIPLSVSPQFFQRLPKSLGTDLVCISSSDHYLDVKTKKGREMILLSLSKAENELKNYDGIRIHRSHWVSFNAITKKIWENDRLFLVMSDGAKLPVGRSYRRKFLLSLKEG